MVFLATNLVRHAILDSQPLDKIRGSTVCENYREIGQIRVRGSACAKYREENPAAMKCSYGRGLIHAWMGREHNDGVKRERIYQIAFYDLDPGNIYSGAR